MLLKIPRGWEIPERGDNDKIYPAKRNAKYALDRPLTDEWATAHYNNFYEFTDKQPSLRR